MRGTRRAALLAIAAVIGIALAAAITWGTSQLVRQRIGLASEPLTAGQRLLPSTKPTATRTRGSQTTQTGRAPTPKHEASPRVGSSTTSTSPSSPPTSTGPPAASPEPVGGQPRVAPERGSGVDHTDSGSGPDD